MRMPSTHFSRSQANVCGPSHNKRAETTAGWAVQVARQDCTLSKCFLSAEHTQTQYPNLSVVGDCDCSSDWPHDYLPLLEQVGQLGVVQVPSIATSPTKQRHVDAGT